MYIMIFSFLISFMSVHSSQIIGKPVFKWLNQKTGREKTLIAEKQKFIEEQRQISMVDNFAKHAKLQRKINSINQKLKDSENEKPCNSVTMQLFFAYGIRAISVFILLIFSIYYRYTPVFYTDVDLFPFTYLVSYPNKESNVVSLPFWIMCCTSVSSLIKIS